MRLSGGPHLITGAITTGGRKRHGTREQERFQARELPDPVLLVLKLERGGCDTRNVGGF